MLSDIFRLLSNITASKFSQERVTAYALVCPVRAAATLVLFVVVVVVVVFVFCSFVNLEFY